MKKSFIGKSVILLGAIALFSTVGMSYAVAADAPAKKEKGPALLELEAAAGKRIEDVKVPEVSKPAPAQGNYEVNKSSSSYDVNSSSSTSTGGKK